METTTVHKTLVKTLGISAAAALFAVFAFGASAQEKKMDPPKKAEVVKKEKAPPAAKTATKPPSPCKGLDEAACKAKAECQWIVPKKGKQKPYCKLKPTPKKKDSKETPAPKDTPPKK